jgi:hypothetical protein
MSEEAQKQSSSQRGALQQPKGWSSWDPEPQQLLKTLDDQPSAVVKLLQLSLE